MQEIYIITGARTPVGVLQGSLSDITAFVKQAARDAGFELAGIAPVRDFPELQRFADWIGAGHHGCSLD